MLSTLVTYAAIIACSADTSSAKDAPAAKPAAAAAPAKLKPEAQASGQLKPQTQTVYRPQTEPSKTESATDKGTVPFLLTQKSGQSPPKFEILAVEQSIVDCTNAERARFGLPALAIDTNLMLTARQHGTWMASYRQFVHSHIGVAENIAMGQSSPQEVLRTWMNSSGHRANILNGGHRRIGVSAYRTPEGTIYWCQQFTP